ncbi:MAG: YtxH domain-containing protein [Rhodothermales bacterium]|nr:YtxH domain-containing protein [Rhodothermales bacterium]
MNNRLSLLLAAAAGFAGGLLTGLLAAPEAGHATRRRLADSARGSTRWMEDRLHALEAQLGEIEQQIEDAGISLADQYLPGLPDDEAAWAVERDEIDRNLRRLPRR